MAAEDAELRDALGHVAVAFDDLEFSVSRFIWALLDEDATAGAIITSDRSFRELIRLASLLYARKVGLALQSFDEIEKRLKQAAEDRDVYSHSWWNTNAATFLRLVRGWPSREATGPSAAGRQALGARLRAARAL